MLVTDVGVIKTESLEHLWGEVLQRPTHNVKHRAFQQHTSLPFVLNYMDKAHEETGKKVNFPVQ